MNRQARFFRYGARLLMVCLLSSCATIPDSISPPDVSLRSVQMTDFSFSGQTFLLGFDIHNPNQFPLPVREVKYGVRLDGQRFASGVTQGSFSVPASGDAEFSISVGLDLLQTAPALLAIVREGARSDIPYALDGELSVNIPLTKPVSFSNSGKIRLRANGY